MDTPLVLVPLFLLVGAIFQAVQSFRTAHGKGPSEKTLGLAAVLAPAASFLMTTAILTRMEDRGGVLQQKLWTWFEAGGMSVDLVLRADRLTAVMLLVITGVGSLIHLYSTAYLKGDPGYARYFACLNLFTFFMTLLVLGGDLLVLFIGWEGVGLCSYLLIGFWWTDDAKAAAGMKAFIVNRVGDAFFLLGAFLLWRTCGTLDLKELHRLMQDPAFAPQMLAPVGFLGCSVATLVCLLLFMGATGKSAQIPLYVWLPDAMAGPTPVSALIHAATMVTAGVYLVARLNGLFALSPTAQSVVLVVAACTCLLAAGMALVQTDIKKVLAYSTVSQLGYMFMGVGSGAIAAGMFHVVTHAFFKACLFLGAGSVIYALHHEQDLRKMGGLRRKLPKTYLTMVVAALAMAGVPPLAGFISKDEILWRAFEHKGAGLFAWVLGSAAAVLTAFYSFRLIFLAFWGPYRGEPAPAVARHGARQAPVAHGHGAPASHGHDPHGAQDPHGAHGGHESHGVALSEVKESPHAMTVPLIVLAVGAAVLGFVNVPHALGGHAAFEHYLAPVIAKAPVAPGHETAPHAEVAHDAGSLAAEYGLMALAILIALGGIVAAHRFYVVDPSLPAAAAAKHPALHARLLALFGVDEFYKRTIVDPLARFAEKGLFRRVDAGFIESLVNGAGALAKRLGGAVSFLQTGSIQSYLTWMVGGAFVLLLLLLA
jgi:NADH-quinone oxidoreductase subunit L